MKHFDFKRRSLLIRDDTELSHDSTDRASFSQRAIELLKKDEEPVVTLSVLMAGVTMFTYASDVASSAALCYWLFDIGRWYWWMTIWFLVASLVLVNVFSGVWYWQDFRDQKPYLPSVTPSHWIMRGMFHAMLLGPLIRFWELFLYGIHTCDKKEPDRHKYRLMFLQEDEDVSYLALIGCFVKSAPLLVLHTYILLSQNKFFLDITTNQAEAFNLATALFELSLAQSSYQRAKRRASPHKKNMNKVGAMVQVVSHSFLMASRVISLAVFTSVYDHWVMVFVASHWLLMTLWLVSLKTSFCKTASGHERPLAEFLNNVVFGLIYVLVFVNIKDEPTRWKYVTYYIIVWIENTVLVVLWFLKVDPELWYRIPILLSVILSLAVGLILLAVYYQYLHPNKLWKDPIEPTRSVNDS